MAKSKKPAASVPVEAHKAGKVINHFGDEVLKVYPAPALGKAK
jgi:hypothetical protein